MTAGNNAPGCNGFYPVKAVTICGSDAL